MSDELFELVFYGKLVDGFDMAQAQANVAQLFKASAEQVARMFTGARVVIRNKMDRDTALKYQMILRKNGAVCQIEPMGGAAPSATTAAPPAPASHAVSPAATAPAPAPKPVAAAKASSPAGPRTPLPQTGRLDLSGKKAAEILSDSTLDIEPVGVTLSEPKEVEAPVFEHLNELSLAPTGSPLAEKRDLPPPIVPDTSGLSIAEPGTRLSDASEDE
ncbi:MAG: hypothetical protein H6999_01105 [Hahellaceae bacterium]|nr:hypothetical protein [Hahellaceae bacterium]MCP5168350.1 hypothetical protein [Hahellaceae bacterium]